MRQPGSTRRQWLKGAMVSGAALATAGPVGAQPQPGPTGEVKDDGPRRTFAFCLNTATIRGQSLSLREQIELAIAVGYDAIEPWVGDIKSYAEDGGSLDDIANLAADNGLAVASAIGFARWIVDDADARAAALEQAREEMALLKQIGGTHIAAPPAGAPRDQRIALDDIAERYHALLEVGREIGIVPQVEVWGFGQNLGRLAEAVYVATEAGHDDACILADAYHLYKGGSAFEGLRLVSPTATHCFHINDYPEIAPAEINDGDRVFPGDGIAPLDRILRTLAANHAHCYLSLELFNRSYWERDAREVVTEGLEKTRAVVEQAFA